MTQRGSESIIMDDDRLEAVSNIVGVIAHDFNNLLTPFLAYPQLIKSDLPEGANGRALLDVMEKTAKDMVHINQQLLDLSSRNGGELYPIDVNDIVSGVVSNLKGNGLLSHGISVRTELAGDLRQAMGGIDCLVRAVNNICLNAVESMGDNGNLEVRTDSVHVDEGISAAGMSHEAGEYIRITVTDSGPGIPDDIKGQIFNPFFTTKKGGSKRGAGLGLSVTFRIVKNCEGFIDFKSGPGQGASFSIYLPVAGSSSPQAVPVIKEHVSLAEPKSSVNCDRKRILVVDDEKTILKLFHMILSSAMSGFTIDIAHNGEEAVNSFSTGHQAVLIMDLHMPVMDGQAAFFKIESLCKENNWEMPSVVFCTGFAPPDSIRGVVDAGSRHCLLSKPVSGETIVEAVKSRLVK